MNKLDKQYTDLLQTILDYGVEKKDRTNTGTKSIFGYTIRHNMKDGFPLITTKKLHWKSIVGELLWFLNGQTNIKWLVDNGISIWTGDAYKRYTNHFIGHEDIPTKEWFENEIRTNNEFANKFGELGKIYGFQWRNWGSEEILVEKSFGDDEGFGYKRKVKEQTKGVDQISELIKQLKENPDSRRLLVSAWNPSDLPNQVLPPCHYGFQVYTRELSMEERQRLCAVFTEDSYDIDGELRSPITIDWEKTPKRAISLMFNMRSVDTGLGLSFNIGSYSLLLMMIAKQVNMVPDEVIGNLGDVHLYLNHIEPIKEQLNREPYPLPTVKISDRIVNDISEYNLDDITLENYQSHPPIKMPLSN